MSATSSRLETAVFQALLPQLEADGFEVFLHPARTMLPPFLQSYRPDAIALKPGRNLAIEIISSERSAQPKVESLRELFSNHADWELRVIYAPPRIAEQDISISSRELIEDHLPHVIAAYDAIGPAASLLIAWSVFEAAARSLMPEHLGKAQTPARLLETLASDGYITPGEAETLRRLGRLRNEAAHGRLDVTLTRDDLDEIVHITRTILGVQDQSPAKVPV